MYGLWGLFSSFLLLSDFQGSQVVAAHSEAWPALAAACAATKTRGTHRSSVLTFLEDGWDNSSSCTIRSTQGFHETAFLSLSSPAQ